MSEDGIRLKIGDLQGLWHRSLIVWHDGRHDETTWVAWLQGPSYYVDLRQPAGRPDFRGIACLRQLAEEQIRWLAGQEGFAGRLLEDGEFFVWQRAVDFQPEAAQPDSGRLRLEGGAMIEEGRYSPYIEHWHREAGLPKPYGALRLRERRTGREGFVVRVGAVFMHARSRMTILPPGSTLATCVECAASLAAAQDLLDCEISFGRVEPQGWIIDRSTLPFKEGLSFSLEIAGDRCRSGDLTIEGKPTTREWDILDSEGDILAFTQVGRDAPAKID